MTTAKSSKAAPEKDHRSRTHRFTAMPVKDIMKLRMADLDVKNVDLATALGYKMPNVIAMIKSGSMKISASKAVECARILKLDPVFFLGKVIQENDAELWDTISKVLGKRMVSNNEMEVVKLMRDELDGHDVPLAADPSFVQAVVPILQSAAKREDALKNAAMQRLEREKAT